MPDDAINGSANLFGRLEVRERRALYRSIVLSAVPIVIGLATVWYTTRIVRNSHEELRRVQMEVQRAQVERSSLRAELNSALQQLQRSREATQYVTQGINYYHQSRYELAVENYDRALALDPNNPYIVNLKGYALFKLHRLQPAIDALQRAVSADPNYAWGYFDLARAYCANGEYDHARDAIAAALDGCARSSLGTHVLLATSQKAVWGQCTITPLSRSYDDPRRPFVPPRQRTASPKRRQMDVAGLFRDRQNHLSRHNREATGGGVPGEVQRASGSMRVENREWRASGGSTLKVDRLGPHATVAITFRQKVDQFSIG
jgi:TPR repeat/Tetratricopeptide repeat